MQVPTYPDGRNAVARLGRRNSRLVEPRADTTRGARLASTLALVLALAVLAACTADGAGPDASDDDLGGIQIGPPTTMTAPTTVVDVAAVTLPEGFVLPDTRMAILPPVLGRPQPERDPNLPSLPVRGGEASLRGTVFGPDGPVGGAVVRLERFVGDEFGREDIATNEDGEWEAVDLIGGRYKVRAWARPDLATIEPQAAFVANKDGAATIDVTVERFDGEQIQGALEVAEPAVGEIHPLKALVSRIEVTEDGIVGGIGLEGREVELTVLGGIRIVGEKKAMTDAEGYVTFSVVCMVTGVHGVTIRSGELTVDVELPECRDGVFDNEALPPELPEFPVGTTFVVPSPGPYPPGTYTATGPGPCVTAYQEFIGDRWAANTNRDRVLILTNPIRNVSAVPDSPVCTFRRTA